MSQKNWVYTVNLRIANLRKSRNLSFICHRCGEVIKMGDRVYSRNANSRKSRSKIYHETCAIEVHIL